MVNLRGDMWGIFVGVVGIIQGVRLGVVYISGDVVVIEFGEVNSICFIEFMFCSSGFMVFLWLKFKMFYFDKVI